MLGGSQIRVAVPQRFEAIIIGITNLIGLIPNIFAIEIATGVIRNIVVTLSRKAEKTAVTAKSKKNIFTIFPFEYSKSFTANHSKS